MVRLYVAVESRLAERAGSDRGEMGPSYIVSAALLGTVLTVGGCALRGQFHWLMSVVGR